MGKSNEDSQMRKNNIDQVTNNVFNTLNGRVSLMEIIKPINYHNISDEKFMRNKVHQAAAAISQISERTDPSDTFDDTLKNQYNVALSAICESVTKGKLGTNDLSAIINQFEGLAEGANPERRNFIKDATDQVLQKHDLSREPIGLAPRDPEVIGPQAGVIEVSPLPPSNQLERKGIMPPTLEPRIEPASNARNNNAEIPEGPEVEKYVAAQQRASSVGVSPTPSSNQLERKGIMPPALEANRNVQAAKPGRPDLKGIAGSVVKPRVREDQAEGPQNPSPAKKPSIKKPEPKTPWR